MSGDALALAQAFTLAVIGGDEAYPEAYVIDDRIALVAITVCEVCGRPINPRTEAEYAAAESVGTHLGDCWLRMKQGLAT